MGEAPVKSKSTSPHPKAPPREARHRHPGVVTFRSDGNGSLTGSEPHVYDRNQDPSRSDASMVRVELSRIVINEKTDEQQIWLREADGSREFSILIGMFEAFAIDRLVKERPSERPLTHDLLASIVEQLEAKIVR